MPVPNILTTSTFLVFATPFPMSTRSSRGPATPVLEQGTNAHALEAVHNSDASGAASTSADFEVHDGVTGQVGDALTGVEQERGSGADRDKRRKRIRKHKNTQPASVTGIPVERESSIDPTIHILGIGAIGQLVAHSLRALPQRPPVTLLTHRRGQLGEWLNSKRHLVIERDGHELLESGFDMELALPPFRAYGVEVDDIDLVFNNSEGILPHEAVAELQKSRSQIRTRTAQVQPDWTAVKELEQDESDEIIHHLVVTVKAHITIAAVSSVRHRLRASSTICLLQNGMGVVDELNKHVFPDPDERPNYILGVVSHGANRPPDSPTFYTVHAGKGTIALTVLPRTDAPEVDIRSPLPDSQTARHILRQLTRSPVLSAISVSHEELLMQKLEKLAQNAVINPITSLIDARNGVLNYNFFFTKMTRLLLGEIALVFRSLPELRKIPRVATRLSAARLESMIVSIATNTAHNVSSMLADVRAGRPTEVKYINGWIVKRGEENGIHPVCNYLMMQAVLGKTKMIGDEMRDQVPFQVPGDRPGKG